MQTANAKPDQEGSKSLSTLDRNAPITQIQIRLANGQRQEDKQMREREIE